MPLKVLHSPGHEVYQPKALDPSPFPGNASSCITAKLHCECRSPHGAGGGPVGADGVGRGVVAGPVQIELLEARDGIGHDGVAVEA